MIYKGIYALIPSSFLGSSFNLLCPGRYDPGITSCFFLLPGCIMYSQFWAPIQTVPLAWHISFLPQQLSLSLDFSSFGTLSEPHPHVTCAPIMLYFVCEGFLPIWLLLICLSSLLYCKLCEFMESPACPQYWFTGRFQTMNHEMNK